MFSPSKGGMTGIYAENIILTKQAFLRTAWKLFLSFPFFLFHSSLDIPGAPKNVG